MNATRAAGAIRLDDSLLRIVRKRAKSFWLCEQAAIRRSRSAATGLAEDAATDDEWEFDSCGTAELAESKSSTLQTREGAIKNVRRILTSVLRAAKNRRQILRKRGTRHHFIAARNLSLDRKFSLHVGKESDD